MPVVEVDEAELLQHRTLSRVAGAIMANPQAKKLLQKAHKLVDPQARTPELDIDEVVESKVGDIAKELRELKAQREAEKAENEQRQTITALTTAIETGIEKLRHSGWTDEGIKGVRELMNEKGILDVEDAAVLFEKKHPPPVPNTPSGSGSWGFLDFDEKADGAEDLKRLIETRGESEPLLRKMTNEALAQVRGGRR